MSNKFFTVLQDKWKLGLTLAFYLIVLHFWGSTYSAHLSYQEQFQLFLFDADYWWERVAVPGGVADYVAEYMTQFYHSATTGAFILAILFVALQLLVWKLMRAQKTADIYYPLSFLPSIFLWHFMCDENAMLAFVIALLLVLLAACAYTDLKGRWERTFFIIIFLPLLYWAAGAVHFIFMGWVIVCELLNCIKQRNFFGAVSMSFGVGILGIACPLLSSLWVQYPLYRLMGGIGYYRFPAAIPWIEVVIASLLVVLPFIAASLPKPKKKVFLCGALQVVIIACGGYYFITTSCDMNKEEAMDYDRLVRNKQWVEIIKKAEQKSPASPFSVTCQNLALGMTGQLADRMFEFYQNGTEGLLPEFQRDFTAPLPAAEAYYYLGMINTAERFTFEAMESIPNFRKSARCYQRLAETNLINGQYEVAAKYLRALRKTMFYKDWAEDAMTYLYNEDKINAHKEWGRLRQLRHNEDFLFSNREIDVMLGLLYMRNHQNRMAFEYMLGYVMQQRDLERFMKYYPLGKDAGYDHIPRSYQEALVYMWTQKHKSFEGMPWSISPEIMREVTDFAQIYTSQQNAQQFLQQRYGGTYWYYLLYKQ